MPDLDIQHLRIQLDTSTRKNLVDSDGNPFWLWRGLDARLEIGVFEAAAVQDLSSLASLNLEVDVSQDSILDPVLTKSIPAASFDNTLDASTWADGSKQHALFELSEAEMNFQLCGRKSRTFWYIFYGVRASDAKKIPLSQGDLVIKEFNAGNVSGPSPASSYYTSAQVDALLTANKTGTNWRLTDDHVELYNGDTESWFRVQVAGNPAYIQLTEVS